MSDFHGFMFSKLQMINSKMEGPGYYLQQFDYSEIPIVKQTEPWKEDPILQKALGTKVTVVGEISSGKIQYEKIIPHIPEKASVKKEHCLKVALKLENEEICLNKFPPSPPSKPFKITLEVEWPYRSIWKGVCPTSQIFDFFVEFEGQRIWRWGEDRIFLEARQHLEIYGGRPYVFTETWIIEPETIRVEGLYTIRGLFIASGQETEKQLRIRFVE